MQKVQGDMRKNQDWNEEDRTQTTRQKEYKTKRTQKARGNAHDR